ncbi:DUF1343 domain-containing protein [Pseudoalteromonas ruthenica]|uniref:exo-beta-N-acetylmuramidase NamZ family protein n=1 Tax=Pseudoalteromonas ruthenica TaxID=151081 RepID=UPI00034979F7
MIRALALILACTVALMGCAQTHKEDGAIRVGAEQFGKYAPLLAGKRVGLVVNQTSRVQGSHLVDFLLAQQVNVTTIFAPEHGFRGDHDAGAHVQSGVDARTGIPIVSIYGANKQPAAQEMADIDVVVFDIQDVGVRFYTYISSMHYMMQASADAGAEFIVLDRPNPNIAYVDGPILDPDFRSFVGMHPIPILHGMTVGELAQMILGEGWLNSDAQLQLSVVPVAHYNRTMKYSLPLKPSPNLPNDQAVGLYPSLCFFEATPVSIGRGTDFPFQVMGHDSVALGDFAFRPRSIVGAAASPKLQGKLVKGVDLRQSSVRGLDLTWLISAQRQFAQAQQVLFTRPDFMDKLAGTDKLRQAITEGHSSEQIKQSWQQPLQQFKRQRAPYLLYP